MLPVILLPVFLIGVYAYSLASLSLRNLIFQNNHSLTGLVSESVTRDFAFWKNTLRQVSLSPALIEAYELQDEAMVREQLAVLVESHPQIVRAFATDVSGLLWSDYPMAPESLMRRFNDRDWYRGLSANWDTYVSSVYRRHADPQPLLVAVAGAVRAPADDALLGAVVFQVKLEGLTGSIRQAAIGSDGYVFLLDGMGRVAAHPHLDLQAREYDDYKESPLWQASREAEAVSLFYEDPISSREKLATTRQFSLPGGQWTVVAQQSAASAFEPIRVMGLRILAIGSVLSVMLVLLWYGLVRAHKRELGLSAQLFSLNQDLRRENKIREQAEVALMNSNDELERRVEERTCELKAKEGQILHAQKMEAIGQLAGGIAHDINNILCIIVGYADLMRDQIPPEKVELNQELEEIRLASERAAGLTRQLLAFGRKQLLKPEVVDVNVSLGRFLAMLRRVLGETIRIREEYRAEPALIFFDPAQLEQVVLNLALNARDAMPEGGDLIVETRREELDENYLTQHPEALAGTHVVITVSDTGTGMDSETRQRIFEPFFTTKAFGRGSGLGLSMIYGVVRQSGGGIQVYSEPGKGSTFKIFLPACDDKGLPVEATPPVEIHQLKGDEVVLLAEDEPSLRTLIQSALTAQGYTVLLAGNGPEAIKIAEANAGRINLFLSDVVLPGKSGPQVARALLKRQPNLKVLFMSGYTHDAVVLQEGMPGNIAYLEKPVRLNVLLTKIREVLDAEEGPGA